ncbi:MAG: hypothetical protein OHK0013_13520 [Sandaracinaceae bacterium]
MEGDEARGPNGLAEDHELFGSERQRLEELRHERFVRVDEAGQERDPRVLAELAPVLGAEVREALTIEAQRVISSSTASTSRVTSSRLISLSISWRPPA